MMKNLAKLLALALVFASLLLVFASCNETKKEVTLDLDALGTALAAVKYEEAVLRLDDSVVKNLYGFTSGAVKVVAYGASGATPEEIVLAEYASEAEAASAKAGFEKRIESQKETFDSYNAEYRPLLDSVVLRVEGKYVILCVSNDTAAANAAVDAALAA